MIYRSPRRTKKGQPERTYLIQARIDAELTQQAVVDKIAEEHGWVVTREALAHWEAGSKNLAVDSIHALADIYGKSVDEMVAQEMAFLRLIGRTA